MSVPFTAPDRARRADGPGWPPPTTGRPVTDRFPAIVLSHGSTSDSRERRFSYTRPASPWPPRCSYEWGFAVLSPGAAGLRPHGRRLRRGLRPLPARRHYLEAGIETARDIPAAVAWLTHQPGVDRERLALVGQSGGGWGSLAAVRRGDLPVRAVVDFAGGRGGKQHGVPHRTCSPERLVEAAGARPRHGGAEPLALHRERPVLLARALAADARGLRHGGGRATYHLLPAIGHDGHQLIGLKSACRSGGTRSRRPCATPACYDRGSDRRSCLGFVRAAPRFAALHSRDYRWYYALGLMSMMADNIEHVISYWVMFQTFHSPALAGFAVISHWVPFLLFSLHMGALADRYDCRKLIQISQVLYMRRLGRLGRAVPGGTARDVARGRHSARPRRRRRDRRPRRSS